MGKMKLFVFLSILLAACLTSCFSDSNSSSAIAEPGCTPDKCLIYAVYSVAGIGDQGYQDLVYYGVNKAVKDYSVSVENVQPYSLDSAEKFIQTFFDETKKDGYKKRLLLLSTDEYNGLFKDHPKWKQSKTNSILVIGNNRDSIDAYAWDVSLYGASYQAGRTIYELGLDSVGVLGANSKTKAVQDAIQGFSDGYKKASSRTLEVDYGFLEEEEGTGFDENLAAYLFASFVYMKHQFDFIFPVIGGGSVEIYRFMREMRDSISFYSCGIDVNQEHQSDNIPFSIEKKTDLLVFDFVSKWVLEEEIPSDFIGTLDSKYADIVVSKNYSDWQSHFDKYLKEAQDAEHSYIEKAQ